MKLTGEMGAFRRDPLGMLERCAKEQGDLARIRFGLNRAVILSHPALVEEVLVTRNQSFRKNPATRRLGTLIGRGLLSSDGEAWRRQRRLTQPAFHRARVNAMGEAIVDYAQRQLATWQQGETRDVHREMMELTLQIACKTLFGAEVAADMQVVREATTVVGEHFLSRLRSLLFLLPDWVPTPGNVRFLRAVHQLDALIYRFIRERSEDRGDLLSMLLASDMSPTEVRDEVMTFFLAGHETTALALTWALYLLALHPSARQKLKQEASAVLGGRAPTVEDVACMAYTRAVVDEALRMYPPAYLQGRQALLDLTVGGQPIQRGTTLLMSQWLIHHDPRFYEAPWEFRPERWLDGSLARQLPRFAYFPFGGGQRQCIGNAFAQLEATLILACIAQRPRLALVPDQRIELQALITLRPKYGMRMTATSLDDRRFGRAFGQPDAAGFVCAAQRDIAQEQHQHDRDGDQQRR